MLGKCGLFFSNNVNPYALNAIGWKYMGVYCGWIAFEFIIVFLLYPETHGRTLEELAFCKYYILLPGDCVTETLFLTTATVFEGDELNNRATAAVEKRIHGNAVNPTVSLEEKRADV